MRLDGLARALAAARLAWAMWPQGDTTPPSLGTVRRPHPPHGAAAPEICAVGAGASGTRDTDFPSGLHRAARTPAHNARKGCGGLARAARPAAGRAATRPMFREGKPEGGLNLRLELEPFSGGKSGAAAPCGADVLVRSLAWGGRVPGAASLPWRRAGHGPAACGDLPGHFRCWEIQKNRQKFRLNRPEPQNPTPKHHFRGFSRHVATRYDTASSRLKSSHAIDNSHILTPRHVEGPLSFRTLREK